MSNLNKRAIFVFILMLLFARIIESNIPKPSYAKIFCDFGMDYERIHDYPKAISFYKKAIYHNPTFPDSYYRLGSIYGQKGDEKQKLEYYRKAVHYGIKDTDPYFFVGLDEFNRGRYDNAIQYLQRITDPVKNIRNAQTYFYLALAQEKVQLYHEAIENLILAIRNQVDYLEAHYHLGLLYYKINNLSNAEDELNYLLKNGALQLAEELRRVLH